MSAPEDLTGRKFGRLTATKVNPAKSKGEGAYWDCLCDCGGRVTVIASSLKRGNTRSCGCLHQEQLGNIDRGAISHKKHGAFIKQKQVERLYSVWKGMKARCYQKNHVAYKYYGGRGIKVCDEWKNDYSVFRGWAMSNGYNPNAGTGECTIDRIDNNGDYEPGNCRFVPMSVQSMNKRKRGTA
jgi:hypothetical protein